MTSASRLIGREPAFIVLEGLDGVGKSTAARRVADLLGAEFLATPGADLEPVRRLLEPTFEGHPDARMLWYASTVMLASDRIRALRRAGRAAVVDRYFLSTLVYAELRGAGLGLAEVERFLVVPHLTVYLHAPSAVREARMRGRHANTDEDLRTLDPAVDARLDDGFRRLGARAIGGAFHPLLAVADPAQVALDIMALVDNSTGRLTSAPAPRAQTCASNGAKP